MALAVLDGNQSATTLSSVVTGGEHIVAHSVVSLGSNAISNITTAISGSTVCVGNLGLLQSTVATEGLTASGSFIKIGGHTGTSTTGNIVHVSAVGALRVDGSVYTQPVSIASVTIGNTVTIAGTVTANPTGTQTIAGTVTVGQIQGYKHASTATNGPFNADVMLVGEDIEASYAAGLVVIPAARGGGVLGGRTAQGDTPICVYGDNGNAVTISGTVTLGVGTAQIGSVTVGNSVTIGSLPSISGVVTAKMQGIFSGNYLDVAVNDQGYLAVIVDNQISISELPALASGTNQIGSVTVGNSVTIGSLPAISGTVTANSSNGSLTTRFGSVTTANTAFATSAVTNSNRKYLLIQNITTASNVITVGVGFTPTTTQGIQLIAGAGITFEGNYIPTGAVNLLSSVTASCFTILEA